MVVFSFNAFGDSVLDSPARPYIAGESYPEQLYDGTYHVRVLPRHLWGGIPRDRWSGDTSAARLAGSGPFRVAEWRRGQFLRLRRADTTGGGKGAAGRIHEVVWRFAADPDAAANLVLSHEADLMELTAAPRAAERVAADPSLEVRRYPSAAYGFLGFNLADRDRKGTHPVLDRTTRRGLAMAVNREALATATFGSGAAVPPGPMSRLLWIWNDSIATLPFDTAAAARCWPLPAGAGHRERSADGVGNVSRSTSWCPAAALHAGSPLPPSRRRGASSAPR